MFRPKIAMHTLAHTLNCTNFSSPALLRPFLQGRFLDLDPPAYFYEWETIRGHNLIGFRFPAVGYYLDVVYVVQGYFVIYHIHSDAG